MIVLKTVIDKQTGILVRCSDSVASELVRKDLVLYVPKHRWKESQRKKEE